MSAVRLLLNAFTNQRPNQPQKNDRQNFSIGANENTSSDNRVRFINTTSVLR